MNPDERRVETLVVRLGEGVVGRSAAAEPAYESVSHTLVPLLSVLFLLAGALPAFYLYIVRKVSPDALIDKYAGLRSLHAFLWNRWFIDGFYNRVFVTGTSRAARFVAEDLEAPLNNFVHRRLPWFFTRKTERIVHHLRADTEELLYNVSYVLILFVMLLTYLFLGTGGN